MVSTDCHAEPSQYFRLATVHPAGVDDGEGLTEGLTLGEMELDGLVDGEID